MNNSNEQKPSPPGTEGHAPWQGIYQLLVSFVHFLRLIFFQRGLIISMAGREIRARYAGSVLGLLWTLVNPMVFLGVFWFVFSVGFRARPVENIPFIVWLAAGFSAWNLFSEIVSGAAGVVLSYRNLVKKTIFPSQILPVVTIAVSLFTHFVYLIILLFLLAWHKVGLSLYMAQAAYYLFCLLVLGLGLSWALSALNVFVRDVAQVVSVVLQVGFWMTPVFWNMDMMPDRYHPFLMANPMLYVVQGYRDSFITHVPFWRHPWLTIYFWSVAIVVLIGGAFLFRKLKPQFADVL